VLTDGDLELLTPAQTWWTNSEIEGGRVFPSYRVTRLSLSEGGKDSGTIIIRERRRLSATGEGSINFSETDFGVGDGGTHRVEIWQTTRRSYDVVEEPRIIDLFISGKDVDKVSWNDATDPLTDEVVTAAEKALILIQKALAEMPEQRFWENT
jgi:hypothetical protein